MATRHAKLVGTMSEDRAHEVGDTIALATKWAQTRPDIRAVALVGSYARGTPRGHSDVDLVVLTDNVESYVENDDWASTFGPAKIVRRQQWGAVIERRLARPSGLKIEINFGQPSWAATDPVDPGTERVVRDGIRPLYDPDRIVARLVEACRRFPKRR